MHPTHNCCALLALLAVSVAPAAGASSGAVVEPRSAPPARRAAESAEDRRDLLRRHAIEHAAERLERQADEAVYRYVPAARPRHLRRTPR